MTKADVSRREFLKRAAYVGAAVTLPAGAVVQHVVTQGDSERLSVKDHGAVGNGAADDAKAISSALSTAHDAGGGTVYFPPGVYRFSNFAAQATYNNVTVQGAGRRATFLQPISNNARAFILTGTNITFRDLSLGPRTIAATRAGAISFLEFTSAIRPKVIDCEIFNTPDIAVAFSNCSDPHAVGNYVHDSKGDGIHFVNCDNMFVCRDNHIQSTEDDMIAVWAYTAAESDGMYGGTVEGNHCDGTAVGGAGISVAGAVGVKVIGNTTKNTVGPGIRVGKNALFTARGSRRITVTGNSVDNPFPSVAGGFGGIEVSEYDASGVVRAYNQVNEDITVTRNSVKNSGNQSYEFSSVKRGTFSHNVGIDANSNADYLSTCASITHCAELSFVANLMRETRDTPRSTSAYYLADITVGTVDENRAKGMAKPYVVMGGTNKQLRIDPA